MARTRSTFILEEAQKRRRRIVEEEDVISQLPDDILVAILSLLSYVEAASTCVLSKRWKSLWTHLTVLNFEFPKMLKEPIKIAESMPVAGAKFVGWVNRALRLHQGPVVNEFKLHFFFTRKTFCSHIDKWFNFAIQKSVQRLEVNLSATRPVPPQSKAKYYFFPNKFFDLIKSPHGLSCIKSLTQLSLRFVGVSGELVEHLLSNCPLLLRLSVSDSPSLVNLNVSGPSLCLKFLEIKSCVCLQSIDIYAPYLTSFICIGGMTQVLVRLRHAPSLVCLTLEHRGGVLTAFPAISSYFSQLESLTLDICVGRFSSAPPPLPELTNLKNLTLQGMIGSGCSLLGWASLIERCPCLHTFTSQKWNTCAKSTWYKCPFSNCTSIEFPYTSNPYHFKGATALMAKTWTNNSMKTSTRSWHRLDWYPIYTFVIILSRFTGVKTEAGKYGWQGFLAVYYSLRPEMLRHFWEF